MGQVTVGGSQQPAVRVQVDPASLAAMNVTMEEVRVAIAQATVDAPKGSLSGDSQSLTIEANDQLETAEASSKIVIAQNAGSVVHLGDVAKVAREESMSATITVTRTLPRDEQARTAAHPSAEVRARTPTRSIGLRMPTRWRRSTTRRRRACVATA